MLWVDRNNPTTIYTLGVSDYVPWGVCMFSRLKFCPTEDSNYLPTQCKTWSCWKASKESRSRNWSEIVCWEKNLETLMALFLAKEKSSGYSNFKGWWIQVSDKRRQELPFWTWTHWKIWSSQAICQMRHGWLSQSQHPKALFVWSKTKGIERDWGGSNPPTSQNSSQPPSIPLILKTKRTRP